MCDIVRKGHYRSLAYMASSEFGRIKSFLEGIPEIGGVYLRPTNGGVTMVDLHPEAPKPRIGVGSEPLLRPGTTLQEVVPTMPGRIAWLQEQRTRQKRPSLENQFEAYVIRHAQANGLQMPGFPDRLRFIHSQWRLDGPGRFTDLIAVDLSLAELVLIELKAQADPSALPQVLSYLEYFREHADELNPFFLRLAQVMGGLYACDDLVALSHIRTARVGLAAWPDGADSAVVAGRDGLGPRGCMPARVGLGAGGHAPALLETTRIELGPQYAGDPPFRAKMRHHQSWYRATVLHVPCGTGPEAKDSRYYGNMLRQEDGGKGLNFLSPQIFAIAQQRLAEEAGTIEPFRLQCNMLSSQPMCFNLFGPLATDLPLATQLWRAVLPGEVDHVTRVLLEYAPTPASEYLADRTAFDAFVEYRRPDGRLAFTGIETKLTEPFSAKEYDGESYRR